MILAYLAQKEFVKLKNGTILQTFIRGYLVRREFIKLKKSIIQFQSAIRSYHAQKNIEIFKYRKKIAEEILQTEQFYVSNLRLIIELFMNPLRDKLDSKEEIISKEQIRTIFSDIEVIYNYNKNFLAQLEPKLKHFHIWTTMGDLFDEMV